MLATGPILIIEDDHDDIYILKQIFKLLGVPNKIIFFDDSPSVLDYLQTTKDLPFIILADINLPKMSGIELKEKINENDFLRKKCVPFIFLSTTHHADAINQAYEMIVQGFFKKEHDFDAAVKMMKTILDYWNLCKHPQP